MAIGKAADELEQEELKGKKRELFPFYPIIVINWTGIFYRRKNKILTLTLFFL